MPKMSPEIPDRLFELSSNSGTNLQNQIQEMLVRTILDGQIAPGTAMPSGRKLADQLKVARNTVVLVYQRLVDEGFLVARERSGYFVSEDILRDRVMNSPSDARGFGAIDWTQKLRFTPTRQRNLNKPADWSSYQYPFIYGQIDPHLFPVNEWRECCRDAATVGAIQQWSTDRIDQDDPELIEQIQTRILPRRGVWAQADEILVTLGAQQALFLIADLLLDQHKTVAIEDPGYPDARNIFLSRTAKLKPIPVDNEGLIPSTDLNGCECLYLTPSHQFPTTVTLSRSRREQLLLSAKEQQFVIIEDDYESEHNFHGNPIPALKSLDKDGVVIYIGSLSKTLAPGLRVGFMTGPKDFIREARVLRRLMSRHPPANNQLIVAQFLKRGYHDALIRRLSHSLSDRWHTLRTAITTYLPDWRISPSTGGSSFWLQSPSGVDVDDLQKKCQSKSLLFESGEVFFHRPPSPCAYLRLGFSSIPVDKIEPGVRQIASIVNSDSSHQPKAS